MWSGNINSISKGNTLSLRQRELKVDRRSHCECCSGFCLISLQNPSLRNLKSGFALDLLRSTGLRVRNHREWKVARRTLSEMMTFCSVQPLSMGFPTWMWWRSPSACIHAKTDNWHGWSPILTSPTHISEFWPTAFWTQMIPHSSHWDLVLVHHKQNWCPWSKNLK